MPIFKWVEEIENIYDNLIEDAKKESLEDIEKLKASIEKDMEKTINNNQEIINSALKTLSKEVNEKSLKFGESISKLCSKIEKNFYENKEGLMNLIFEKLGFDF